MSLAKRVMERKLAGQAFDFAAAAAAAQEAAQAASEGSVTEGSAEGDEAAPAPAEEPVEPHAAAGGSIARRHRLRVLAKTRTTTAALGVHLDLAAANDAEDPAAVAAAEVRMRLDADRLRLKQIQSTKSKIVLKRELVLNYDAWVQGVLAAAAVPGAKGVQDEALITMMIWRIDIGDYVGAIPLIEYVLRWGLEMPGHFKSTAPVFVVETIAEDAIKAYYTGGDVAAAFPAGVLPAIEDLTVDEDMHDQVRAKLQKAIGMAIMSGANTEEAEDLKLRQAETLRRYTRALELDGKAGVKKQIEQLNRDLGKPTVPGRLDQSAPATE